MISSLSWITFCIRGLMIKQIRTSRKIIIMMSRQSVKHFFIPSFDLSVWNYNWQLCMQSRCRSIQHNIVKKISKKPTPVKPNVSWGFFQSLLKCVLWLLTWTCVGRRVPLAMLRIDTLKDYVKKNIPSLKLSSTMLIFMIIRIT